MATQSQRQEWIDYFPDMEHDIKSGALDDIIVELMDALAERTKVMPLAAGQKRPEPPDPSEVGVLMDAIPIGAHGVNAIQHFGKWFDGNALIGNRVRISSSVRPRYLIGVEVIVKKINRTTATVEVAHPEQLQGRRFDSTMKLPFSLMDVRWESFR